MPHDITVAGIRAHVRDFFDVDYEDMPDTIIDRWTSEGWGKVVRYRRNWPGFESTATLATVNGTHTYVSPLRDIVTIDGPDRQLVFMDDNEAKRRFIVGGVLDPAGKPRAYSVWANNLRLWPTPNAVYSLSVTGYRKPVNPLEQSATFALDLPHSDAAEMVLDWVMYRAAQREGEFEQANDYKDSFSQGMQLLAKDETDTPSAIPIVLNSRRAPALGTDSTLLPERLRYADGWEG